MRALTFRSLVGLGAVAVLLAFGVTGAAGQEDVQHGIGFTKGCESPTKIGDPYTCSYTVRNVLDEAEDTVTITGLRDVVHAASGDVDEEIFGDVEITTTTTPTGATPSGATCTAAGGTGVFPTPYTGVTSCTLPFGSRVNVLPFSHYDVQPGDFALPNNQLRDDAFLTWHDLCDDPAGTLNENCEPDPPPTGASSLSLIEQLTSQTATDIHNAAHQVVTAVAVGSTVHDLVRVTGEPGGPTPTGNVNVDWFLNGDCSGAPAANSGSIGPLDASGQFDATGFAFTVNDPGMRAFRGHYEGDATYIGSDGPCEPLQVVDANIQITPDGVNPVGTTHTFTAHVNVNDGSGFVNAPDGTQISFAIDSGPGSFTSANPCTTSGGTGSCTIDLTSAVPGTTVVSASTTLTVAGVELTRTTNGQAGNSEPAEKQWVAARILIEPDATNAVGEPHTFTVTVERDLGAGYVAVPGVHAEVTLTDSGGAAHTAPTGTCTAAGPNTDASGQCTITFTSPTAGQVTGHAEADVPIDGTTVHVATDGTSDSSDDAVKTFVDANIQITPATDTNAVNTPHTLTITVNALNGTLDAGTHTATAEIVDGPGDFVGPATCDYTGGGASASCTVVIQSATTGTSEIKASSTIPVDGQPIPRATETAVNTAAGGSDNAEKEWVNANIQITPATDTNAVNTPHTLTITVNALNGTLDAGTHTATAEIVDGPGDFVGPATCDYTGGGASASCTVVIQSATTGTSEIKASSTIPVDGQPIPRATETAVNTAAGGSDNAEKEWVNANIQITPATDTNAVNTPHTLTITVNALNGTLDAGTHTATAEIVDGPGDFVGPATCDYTGGGASASCTVVIQSATTGTSEIKASSTIPVDGQPIPRATETAVNTAAGGSDNAEKEWVNANIQITPATDTNAVNTPHTLTITVNALNGTLDAGTHTATAEIVDGPGDFVGPATCDYTGGGASASCTVVIQSATTGTSEIKASSTIPVDGQPIPRATETAVNTAAGGSDNAEKEWVNANIQITPATDTNAVNTPHTLTITVNALNGTLDAGTHTATAEIVDGPGDFVGPATCDYTGGGASASCTVVIQSATTGTSEIKASSTIPVDGQPIPRATETAVNTAAGGSDNAEKEWVNANIQITPATDTNAVNTPHTLTITVNALNGTLDAGTHTATAEIVDGPGAFVGPATCDYTGGGASASCTVVIQSATTGTSEIKASSTIPVDGQPIPRATETAVNTAAGGSDNAEKEWVNANIQITPATAVNPVGTEHTLTITVNALNGTLDAGTHTATADIVSGPGSFVGGDTCDYTGGGASASCTVVITSATPGTTVIKALADIPVDGQSIHRETNTAVNTTAGGSGNAEKNWAAVRISITPDATNEVGQPHTFTATVERDTGGNFGPVEGVEVTITLTNDNGAVADPAGPVNCTTNAAGQCSATFTSATAGTVTGHAAADVLIPGDGTVHVETNGEDGNSDDAVKTFVDARISITPQLDTNPVTATHTFTAHVEVNAGNGLGFVDAPNGTQISFEKDSGPGTLGAPNPCTTAGGTGTCTITLETNATGTTVVSAHTTVTVGGVALTRHTNGQNDNSGPATKLWADANVRTDVHDANHGVVTSVLTGTVVHDKVFVTREAGTPAGVPDPTGSVVFHRYSNISCSGESPVNETVPLSGDGTAESSAVTATADLSYKASYLGDANYPARDGACEPLAVTFPPPPPPPPPPAPDARISITPPTATNPVNTNHVLTGHVVVQSNTGAAFVNAPDGTPITFSIASGPGSFTTTNPCTTSGGTGSCTITLTSAVAGTTVVSATTTLTVSGIALTRVTNGQNGNSGPAEKLWVVLTPPPVCESLSATPRQLKAGKAMTVVARVLLDNGSPMVNARVRLRAPGTSQVRRTNAQGVARFSFKPKRKGIATLSVIGSPQCSARRGILGVPKPPPITG